MFKKILIPLDGSARAEAALPLAQDLAECYGAQMILFHANTPLPAQYYAPAMFSMVAELEQTSRKESDAYIRRVADHLTNRGLQVTTELSDDFTAAGAILDYVEHNGVDLIAMSTHGRTGLGRWLMGSVADKVVHGATVPVLLVRPDEARPAGDQGHSAQVRTDLREPA